MTKFAKLEIQYWPLERFQPYENNPRINDHAVKQAAAAIEAFGFRVPVIAKSDGEVTDGHLRLKAAEVLGMKEVPTVLSDDMTEAQIKGFRISVNKIADLATWDTDLLKLELESLHDIDFDLDVIGFDAGELDELFAVKTDGLTDEDAVPEAPETPVTVPGDVWLLGRHRLMCGDSTSADAVGKLMADQVADMVFTDPPYGMAYGGGRAAGSTKKGALVKAHGMILGDDLKGGALIGMIREDVGAAAVVCKSGSAFYICFPWRTYAEFEAALNQIGLDVAACIVWDKKSIGLGRANYRPQHEFIFYIKGDVWHGDKSQSDVWYMSRGATGEYVHPTQKPVELIEKAIFNSSKIGDMVVDVFGGSGSTIIACEKASRDCRMMELDPKYCDVIIQRWQDFTGKQATLEATGHTFEEVTKCRAEK